MKRIKGILFIMLSVCLFMACSSDDSSSDDYINSDDDEFLGTGLTGIWDLVEVQNGPAGFCRDGYANQYPSGSVIVKLKKNGKIFFKYEDGKVDTLDYSIPEDQEKYYSTLPVMLIGETPFGYDIEEDSLKLLYEGIHTCDHVPATFVFKRIK